MINIKAKILVEIVIFCKNINNKNYKVKMKGHPIYLLIANLFILIFNNLQIVNIVKLILVKLKANTNKINLNIFHICLKYKFTLTPNYKIHMYLWILKISIIKIYLE